MTKTKPIVVLGGGRAELTNYSEIQELVHQQNHNSNNNDKINVDNGQHLLPEVQDSTLDQLNTVGIGEESVGQPKN